MKIEVLICTIRKTNINVLILLVFTLFFNCDGKIHDLDSLTPLSSRAMFRHPETSSEASSSSDYDKSGDPNRKIVKKSHALIFICDHIEEMHFAITNEVLVRAGMNVRVSSITQKMEDVLGINEIMFIPNSGNRAAYLNLPYDVVILCGGPGFVNMLKDEEIRDVLREQQKANGLIGVIGDSLKVLKEHKIGFKKTVSALRKSWRDLGKQYKIDKNRTIVIDDNLITCNATGSVMEFALTIVENVLGLQARREVTRNIYRGNFNIEKYQIYVPTP